MSASAGNLDRPIFRRECQAGDFRGCHPCGYSADRCGMKRASPAGPPGRVISGFRTEPGSGLPPFMQDGAAETVARVRHGHAGCGPDPADAVDRDRHRPFPVSGDMSDAGADGRARRIAPPDAPGHGPATRLPAVDTGAMAPRLRPGPVPRRAVTGVRPDGSGATGRVRFAPFGLPGPGISGCPAGVGVCPCHPGGTVRPDAGRAPARPGPFPLFPRHPPAWGRDRSDVHGPAARGPVAPVTEPLAKTPRTGT